MRFIDLFAGIGGFRSACESLGGTCVFTSEWDKDARKAYVENYHESEAQIAGDITKVDAKDIPDHELLCAGFPCQPFSSGGIATKAFLGRESGFLDKTQGTLFFEVARILREKQPKMFLLENVKNLKSHDKGKTFKTILETLQEIGYDVHWKVVDAKPWVPQHRERTFIVGFLEKREFSWDFDIPEVPPKLKDILDSEVPDKYTLSDGLWAWHQRHAAEHKAKGNGFGYSVFTGEDISRTLSARYYKDGAECLILQEGKNPRKLTPRECARLMGFPEEFKIISSDTKAYHQFGNSVVVPLIREIVREMV
jgi:DNA (cytosine-5)-methyltransferase 1